MQTDQSPQFDPLAPTSINAVLPPLHGLGTQRTPSSKDVVELSPVPNGFVLKTIILNMTIFTCAASYAYIIRPHYAKKEVRAQLEKQIQLTNEYLVTQSKHLTDLKQSVYESAPSPSQIVSSTQEMLDWQVMTPASKPAVLGAYVENNGNEYDLSKLRAISTYTEKISQKIAEHNIEKRLMVQLYDLDQNMQSYTSLQDSIHHIQNLSEMLISVYPSHQVYKELLHHIELYEKTPIQSEVSKRIDSTIQALTQSLIENVRICEELPYFQKDEDATSLLDQYKLVAKSIVSSAHQSKQVKDAQATDLTRRFSPALASKEQVIKTYQKLHKRLSELDTSPTLL